jgi:putative nucleotidyltransferase with HDIG domain
MLRSASPPVQQGGRRCCREDQARALAVVLRDEFGTDFAFVDAETLAPVPANGSDAALPPREFLEQVAASGRARVTPLRDGVYQLALLLCQEHRPALVAVGQLDSPAAGRDGPEAASRLEKWAQAVSDRVRLQDQLADDRPAGHAPSTLPWEGLLALDQIIRRLRLHKNPERNYQRILEAASTLLGAELLAWVPRDGDAPVLTHGEACLAPAECRQLAASMVRGQGQLSAGPVLLDRSQKAGGSNRYPRVHTLLALPVSDQGPAGWILAINKKAAAPAAAGTPAHVPFRKSDAALLTPFVGLLELHLRWSSRYLELKELLVGLTRALTAAIDAKDSYTFGHSERVGRIAVELAREMGIDGEDLGDIYLAGLLHDIGKIGIRDDVLRKPGKLTPEEQEHIRQHVTIGYSILADLRQIRNLLPGVLYHHERWDGQGYPDGLAGDNIPLMARILAVADSYDAMTTVRPYRDSMPWTTVERILAEGAGSQWDKRVVEAFQRCRHKIHTIRQRGVGESLRAALEGALRSENHSLRDVGLPTS